MTDEPEKKPRKMRTLDERIAARHDDLNAAIDKAQAKSAERVQKARDALAEALRADEELQEKVRALRGGALIQEPKSQP